MSVETTQRQVEHDVLLVNDKTKNKIQVVKGLDKDGKLETVPATKKNQNQFLKVDRHGDFFSNFFSNFFSQLKNPTQFTFFRVPELLTIKMANQMQKELNQSGPTHELFLKHQITEVGKESNKENKVAEPTKEEGQYNSNKFDIKDIDWDSLSRLGLSKEKLQEMDLLEPLLQGYKTKDLVAVNLDLGSAVFSLDARLSLQKNEEGKVVMALEGVKKYPNLNVPLYGHEFSKQDKHNLLKTGNMGRVVELVHPATKEKIPSVVSVDRLTNNLVVTRVEKMQLPQEVKGIVLSEEQLQTLKEGKPLLVEGMTSAKGNLFNAEIQFNAAKGHIEFLFDNTNKQNQNQSQSQSQLSDDLKSFRGKELTEKQQSDLLEGKPIYIKDLLDKRGNMYQGYVTYNKETKQADFSFQNPNKEQQSKVQSQSEKQTDEPKKSKGRKM
ncbi:DUF3945 domain-containing protein [Myroides marinus]|uniref:DUF3945 domain-containing protein n=1 Tax=Myroides marinus TaxID=703342 RepID=UPI002577D58B|nr:DUF3945 domain-containing protein [Myroides marinus]MDM1377718.1 DUF3945 domain-containing protein [Myroides marinus]MDM1385078.1 DUF3945 domain-containing protein [Myroides marinus]MDM1392202.1 DUF3945 domain-containing protein [Myroides marinus]